MPKIVACQNASLATLEAKETAEESDTDGGESSSRELICALCFEITSTSEKGLISLLRKHGDSCEAAFCCCRWLKIKDRRVLLHQTKNLSTILHNSSNTTTSSQG
jgi:hypothetical protein